MFVGYVDRNGYGYTFDGKRLEKRLCDENGEPIMRERITLKEIITYDIFRVGKLSGKELLHKYDGVFYKTNQRLIGVRDPKAWEVAMRDLPTPGSIADAWRIKAIAKAGGREYFELLPNEIVKCKKHWGGLVFIEVSAENRKKYWLRLIPSKVKRKKLHDALLDILR